MTAIPQRINGEKAMRMLQRSATSFAILLLFAASAEAGAQERRDSTRRAVATSAEEMHRIRRAWLEQRRLGQLDETSPRFGSAVVGPPRSGTATGIVYGGAVPAGYGSPHAGYGAVPLRCDAYVQPGGTAGFGGFGGFGGLEGMGGFGGYGGLGAYGGFGGYGGRAGVGGNAPFGATAFAGHCVPVPLAGVPYGAPGAYGIPGSGVLADPAYPPYGRFYERFHPEETGRGGWTDPLLFGVQEYDWSWYGPRRTYPGQFGWSDGAYGWYSAPAWSGSPSDCVDLTVELANGRVHRVLVGLQSLGLADVRDLDLAIDARLSEGRPVLLQGLDGRVVRIEPGAAIDDIIVRPCGG
jgi:hypothetical protein